ncbi:MAG TPA: pseudouridine synthase [Armatimonadota bacterium]
MLAAAGVASRRAAEDLIRAGRVSVNGTTSTLGDRADAESDVITVDGRPIPPPRAHVYVILNKPAGYACTRYDPHISRTVYDLLPIEMETLFTVGRLDVDTEGLLLLTNDGEWANNIAHPRTHVPKTYLADVYGEVTPQSLDALRWGIPLEEGVTLPALVREVWHRPSEGRSRLQIVISEGRKRQVRRMLDYVGLRVAWLERVAVGSLHLDDLPVGRWRYLDEREVLSLKAEANG